MKLIKADSKDINDIVDIEESCGYHKDAVKLDLKKLFINFFNSSRPYAYILEDKGKSIGYFAFRIVGDNCELDYPTITKKYQGKGFGKLLINKIMLLCKSLRIKKIKLSARVSNNRAIELYKSYGFENFNFNKNKLFMIKELG